ncbi:MAG: HAD hydrolase family protein [Candidatus Rokubacteria bacterium]|nr:HAD hydrolase family protein [Candidatus Rokubacteria bacterium]
MRTPATRAALIRLLVLDVDGVLTDGGLLYGAGGEEIKRFDVHDGWALAAARRAGLEVGVISGRASAAVTRRMAELGIQEVHQGVGDKPARLAQIMARLAVEPGQVAVMGDDLPDLPLMKTVALALAPANAAPEVRRAAHWVSRRRGGEGAVREAIEMILRARKAWPPPEPASR